MLSLSANKILIALLMCAAFGAFAAPAASASSALDQYVEEIPDTTGDGAGLGNSKGNNTVKVDKKQAEILAAAGEDGQILLAIANATGPSDPPSGAGASSGEPGGSDQMEAGTANGQIAERPSGLGESFSAAVSASGFSFPLFLVVVAIALAMGAIAWLRRQDSAT
jgi:hypothetical protein